MQICNLTARCIVECMTVYLDCEPGTLLLSPFIGELYDTWPREVKNDQGVLEGFQQVLAEVESAYAQLFAF